MAEKRPIVVYQGQTEELRDSDRLPPEALNLNGIKETTYTITDGPGFEIDPGNGLLQSITLGANRVPAATKFENGQAVKLRVDDGSAYTLDLMTTAGAVWVGGTAELITSGRTHIMIWMEDDVLYAKNMGASAS